MNSLYFLLNGEKLKRIVLEKQKAVTLVLRKENPVVKEGVILRISFFPPPLFLFCF